MTLFGFFLLVNDELEVIGLYSEVQDTVHREYSSTVIFAKVSVPFLSWDPGIYITFPGTG